MQHNLYLVLTALGCVKIQALGFLLPFGLFCDPFIGLHFCSTWIILNKKGEQNICNNLAATVSELFTVTQAVTQVIILPSALCYAVRIAV